MTLIENYVQFITKQKEKNDFGYPSKIEEAGSMEAWRRDVRVHFNDVGGKKVPSRGVSVMGTAYKGNPSPEQIHKAVENHETVKSHAKKHRTSMKRWDG